VPEQFLSLRRRSAASNVRFEQLPICYDRPQPDIGDRYREDPVTTSLDFRNLDDCVSVRNGGSQGSYKKIAYSDLVSQQRDPIFVLSVRRVSARFGIKLLYSGSVYRFVEGLVPSNAYPLSGPCGGGAAAPRATPGGRHKG